MFLKRTKVRSRQKTYTYLQLVESVWRNGRPTHRVVANLGREDQVDPDQVDRLIRALAPYTGREVYALEDLELVGAREYGVVAVLEHLWQMLELGRILAGLAEGRSFGFDVEKAVRALVYARVVAPSSDRGVVRWLKGLALPEMAGLGLHHLYRALDFLAANKEKIEARLLVVLTQKLFADVSLVLFDTTSVYFEGEGPGELTAYGYSRDKRPDRPQFVLGLLTTRNGLPLAHLLLPGNTSDLTSLKQAVDLIYDKLPVGGLVLVCDRGMVSKDNLETLDRVGIRYIVGTRLRSLASRACLARAGRYREVEANLKVKEVWHEGRRYIVCFNPQEAERDRLEREGIIAHLEEELAKGVKSLLKGAARRYVCVREGRVELNRKAIAEDAHYDGKWVLLTTTDLPAQEVALAYKGLWRVERAFRTLKTPLEIRPVYHWNQSRVQGHVMVCVLAYLLERLLEEKLQEKGLAMSAEEAFSLLSSLKVAEVAVGNKTVRYFSRPTGEQEAILKALGLRTPPKLETCPSIVAK
jgi:hypothetical protein